MARGKANESNKAKKSSNTKSDTKGSSQNKKKSDSAADKNKSKAGEKVVARQTENSRSCAAASKASYENSNTFL